MKACLIVENKLNNYVKKVKWLVMKYYMIKNNAQNQIFVVHIADKFVLF